MKRVTCKRRYPVNDLLIYFLTEFKETERKKNGDMSRMLLTYNNALKSLKAYPIEIKEVEELKNLIYFGDVILTKLTKKFDDFRKEHGEPTQKTVKKLKQPANDASDMPKTAKGSGKKEYMPQPESGSYAILRTLYDDAIFNNGIENGGLYLEDLRKASDVYSREAMVKNSAFQHYTPFSCLTTLMTKRLTQKKKVGRKDVVSLTEEGYKLAEKLFETAKDDDNDLSAGWAESKISTDIKKVATTNGTTTKHLVKKFDNKRTKISSISSLSKDKDTKNLKMSADFDLAADSDEETLKQSDEEIFLPLSARLGSKSFVAPSKVCDNFDESDRDKPGPSWKHFTSQTVIETSSSLSSLKTSKFYDGYIYVTPELNETLLKSEACKERNQDLDVDIVWIKTTEFYMKAKSYLYVLSSNEGIFEDPYVLVYLALFDGDEIAPGLKNIEPKTEVERKIIEPKKEKSEPVKFTKIVQKTVKSYQSDKESKISPSEYKTENVSHSASQTKKFSDVQIVTNDIVLESNTFEIVLIADFAEVKGGAPMTGEKNSNRRDLLGDYFQQRGILFESRKLNVGDYLWIARNRHGVKSTELVLDLIIERKRIDDLAKSITDGRWDSQKYRLKRCGLRKVMYLFEDLPKSMKQPLFNPAALRSAMINAEIQDGFSVEKTLHTKDTAEFISRMTKFLIRNFKGKRLTCRKFNDCDEIPESDGILDLDSNSIALLPFEEFQKLALKPRRFTVGDNFVMCLMQIAGVSIELAKGIGSKFGTFRSLMNAYGECGDDEKAKIKLLEDIKSGAQSRRLGPCLAKKIADYFCYEINSVKQ